MGLRRYLSQLLSPILSLKAPRLSTPHNPTLGLLHQETSMASQTQCLAKRTLQGRMTVTLVQGLDQVLQVTGDHARQVTHDQGPDLPSIQTLLIQRTLGKIQDVHHQ